MNLWFIGGDSPSNGRQTLGRIVERGRGLPSPTITPQVDGAAFVWSLDMIKDIFGAALGGCDGYGSARTRSAMVGESSAVRQAGDAAMVRHVVDAAMLRLGGKSRGVMARRLCVAVYVLAPELFPGMSTEAIGAELGIDSGTLRTEMRLVKEIILSRHEPS